MRVTSRFILILILSSAAFGQARASQTLPETEFIPLTTTDFTTALFFNRFDSSLGTLTGVSITLNGHIDGTGKFENGSNAPATILLHLQATIALNRPDGSQILTTIPVVNTTDTVTNYDGTVDFSGGSGRIHSNLVDDQVAQISLSSPGDLSLFLGTGSIALPLSASARSSASGSGNLFDSFSTMASASGTIVYTYTPNPLIPPPPQIPGPPNPGPQIPVPDLVPEPTTLAAACCGGLVLIVALRRRRAQTS